MAEAVDPILLFVLAVVLPIWGVRHWKRTKAEVASGKGDARLRAWLLIVFVEWSLAAVLLLGWAARGLPPSRLGVRLELDRGFVIAAAIVAAAAAFLYWQLRTIRAMTDVPEALARSLATVEEVLPRTRGERSAFVALALTAGFCEELLYRGFLIDWFAARWGMAAAVAGSTIVFAVGHAYQNVSGIVKTGAAGLVAAAIYLLSGSIWLPMILHAIVDVNGGYVGFEVLSRRSTIARAPEAESPAGEEA